MLKLDFGAEARPLERYTPRGVGYYEVDCPFCETNQLVQTRKFHQGVRCVNAGCRAMLRFCTRDATRDLLPANETVIVHGLRTRIGWEGGPQCVGSNAPNAASCRSS
ncbi:MAG: hypothetical protein IKO55_04625 [Kiritimatiellae bacterium]|nr:hypothetical protein [Kiritimatiellia bacterium]